MQFTLPMVFIALVATVAGQSPSVCPFNCVFTAMGSCFDPDASVLDSECFCATKRQEMEMYHDCMREVCRDPEVNAITELFTDFCPVGNGMIQHGSVSFADLMGHMKSAKGGEMRKMLAGRQYSGRYLLYFRCITRSRETSTSTTSFHPPAFTYSPTLVVVVAQLLSSRLSALLQFFWVCHCLFMDPSAIDI
jgi:hypothetical protein